MIRLFSNTAALLLLTLSFTAMSASAGALPDSSLKLRNIRQQIFARDYVQAHLPAGGFASPGEAVRYMERVATAWAEATSDQSPIYRRLNAYVPMWILHRAIEAEVSDAAKCAVWTQFAAPSFIADVEALADGLEAGPAVRAERAFLIRTSNLDWGVSPSFRCKLAPATWEDLHDALNQYPELVAHYQDRLELDSTVGHAGDDAQNEQARRRHEGWTRAKRWAEGAQPLVALQDQMYAGERNAAFAALAAQLPDSDHFRYGYVYLGKRLAAGFRQVGETGRALATLDLLARHTANETLPRGELRALYAEADSLRGPARFEAATRPASDALAPSEETVDVVALLKGVETANAFDRASLDGRPVLLDFWSISCGPCIEEIPDLNRLAADNAGELTVVSINSDLRYGRSRVEIEAFIREQGIQYPVLLGTEEAKLMEQMSVRGWPARFLVGPDGALLEVPAEKRTHLALMEVRSYLEQR